MVYFGTVGTAFMFIEIAFIQKFILFLNHPLYTVSVVLCAFLVFAGLGSMASARWRRPGALTASIAGIGVLCLSYALVLPALFAGLVQLHGGFKIAISVLLIAPLAFCMGMPFPLGLRRLAETAPAFIPWAWGINGFASVISAALATLLALHFGFTTVLLLALMLYVLAAALFSRAG
jgi:hypothetical protein